MMRSHSQYTEYKVSIYSEVVCLKFTKSCVSAAQIEWSFKFQLIPLSLSFFFIFIFNILIWLETVTRWNITSSFFCLDGTDTKNKKMDANTEKLKGTLKKKNRKSQKDMTLFRSLALIPTDANLMITQPTIKIEIWSWKAKIGLIGVWHNGNLPQGTNTIGMSRMTPRSQLIFNKSDSVRSRTEECKNHSHTLKLKNSE